MADVSKIIESFFENNGLHESLKTFRAQFKRAAPTPKNANNQLSTLSKVVLSNDHESQAKLRDYLQKSDAKILKKFVERIKKSGPMTHEQTAMQRLGQLPFFKRLIQKQSKNYREYKQNTTINRRQVSLLDQSRINENQWEGQNDLGFEVYQFPMIDIVKVAKQISNLKHYQINAVKEVPFPFSYFQNWEALKSGYDQNTYDKTISRLPTNVRFESGGTKEQPFPRETDQVVLECYQLKVIYNREKTGFEDEREMPIIINQVLAGRFQVVSVLGQAQFSKAIQIRDLTSPGQKQRYCLKMVHNNKEFMDQALDEIKLLRYIKANCDTDACSLVTLYDSFYHREHLMLLTQLLKENLYDAFKTNPQYFTLSKIQSIAKQILTALATLHRLHIIHCDLKPENILIKSYTSGTIKVIDVGSSVFFHDKPLFYIQTRSYRAPQLVLGCQYTQKIDIWSLGCILAELYSGKVLFECDNTVALLAKIQGLRGPWPSWMLQKGSQVHKYFTKELVIFEQIAENGGQQGKSKKRKTGLGRIYTPKTTNLKSRITCDNKNFVDFLGKCLKIDPSVRLSAKEALNHPFFKETLTQ